MIQCTDKITTTVSTDSSIFRRKVAYCGGCCFEAFAQPSGINSRIAQTRTCAVLFQTSRRFPCVQLVVIMACDDACLCLFSAVRYDSMYHVQIFKFQELPTLYAGCYHLLTLPAIVVVVAATVVAVVAIVAAVVVAAVMVAVAVVAVVVNVCAPRPNPRCFPHTHPHQRPCLGNINRARKFRLVAMRPCLISTARRRLKVASSLSALNPSGSQKPTGSWTPSSFAGSKDAADVDSPPKNCLERGVFAELFFTVHVPIMLQDPQN